MSCHPKKASVPKYDRSPVGRLTCRRFFLHEKVRIILE